MKQPTAVDWLFENILMTPLDIRSINKCYLQAKEMELEQIIKAFNEGTFANDEKVNAKQYYNQTFEK
jgi:hypothetical protein